MMMSRSKLVLVSSLLLAAACQADDDYTGDASVRDIYFDGAEIKEELAQNPDAVFFADLRDGTLLHFDQSEEPIDYANFIVQCPTMPTPIPMEQFLLGRGFDEEMYTSDYWAISAGSNPQSFGECTCGPKGCPYGTHPWCPKNNSSECYCMVNDGNSY